jgi:hypothetical protein
MVTIIVPFPSGIQIDTLACSFLVLANPPRRYNVKVAHPLMVKAIAYAKLKTDKVDARILADLLRTDLIPAAFRNVGREKEPIFHIVAGTSIGAITTYKDEYCYYS